jgi:hypothetical protein
MSSMYAAEIEAGWQPVQLPSWGLYYGPACPQGKVLILPWRTAQEELIVRYSASQGEDLMDMLVQDNVRLPEGMVYEELLVSDKLFLLFQLRIASLTPYYTATFVTTGGHQEEKRIDLRELRAKVPDDLTTPAQEPFHVRLPRCKREVGLRLLRVRDEKAVLHYARQAREKLHDQGAPGFRIQLARQIETIDGQPRTFDERMEFVRSLIMADSVILQGATRRHETGLDTEVEVTIGGEVINVRLPLGAEFFRPRESDILAAFELDESPGLAGELSRPEGVLVRSREAHGGVPA